MLSTQRTGLVIWRVIMSTTAPGSYGRAVTLAITGMRGAANVNSRTYDSNSVCAGAM
jgi:hypothetical protein